MAGNYFSKFPIITYSGKRCVDISARPAITDLVSENLAVFYPFTLRDGQRPDNVSYDYYDDPDMVWLIALANGMTDLYYDFPLSEDDLNGFISKTYGSQQAVDDTVLYFRNNWAADESEISPESYDSMPPQEKRYWNPVATATGAVIAYTRKQEDWILSTNKVVSMVYDSVSGTFQPGEDLLSNGIKVGYVVAVGDGTITVQHIVGAITEGMALSGGVSGATGSLVSFTILAQPIPDGEASYWSPVSALDFEQENNQKNRSIRLLDNRFQQQVKQQLKKVMG